MMKVVCHFHGEQPSGEPCKFCMEEYPNLPDPATMTGKERREELSKRWRLTMTWDMQHRRINALVGRDVATIEMQSSNIENLMNEAEHWPNLSDDEIYSRMVNLIPAEKRIIIDTETGDVELPTQQENTLFDKYVNGLG